MNNVNKVNQEINLRRKILFEAVCKAGAILIKHYGKLGVAQAYSKGGYAANLASRADTQSQEIIIETIKKRFPQDHFLAEEGELGTDTAGTVPNFLWVIDPLDGTINFLHSYPLFAVSIALVFNGDPVLGAILDPIRDELFWAQKGKGAYLNKGRIRVTKTKELKNALLVTGFAYDRQERAQFYLSYYKAFLKVAHDVRRTGSACIDLAWLASGRHDGFWEWGLNTWDVAVGALLIKEAGGQITHFDNKPYNIFKSEQTLATNGRIHGECLKIL